MDAVEFEADVPANPLLGGGETATERVTIVMCAMCLSRAIEAGMQNDEPELFPAEEPE